MKALLTGDDLYAAVLMFRTADARTIVLLEGPSDCAALDPHIDEEMAQTIPGHSKSAVERAIELSDSGSLERVLAILDRDWTGILAPPSTSENVAYTDYYDLDATIFFAGDVATRLLSSIVDRDQCGAHVAKVGMAPVDIITQLAGVVGTGRLVVARDNLQIRFESFPIHESMDVTTGTAEVSKLAAIAVRRSKDPRASDTDLSSRIITELERPGSDLRILCSGHDIAAATATLAREAWGGGVITSDTVAKIGRAALSCRNLQAIELYRTVMEWADGQNTRVWNCAST